MSEQQEFATHIVDLLAHFGSCESRRMFGGFGIFHQGLMIALVAEGSLYFKADDQTRTLFEKEGSEAFTYFKQDKEVSLSYYLAPEAIFEESEACQYWAGLAYDAALRSPYKKKATKGVI